MRRKQSNRSLPERRNTFRVIAGKWRSRRLNLHPNAQLRPTSDRIRETLFNWLGHDVINAHCLDLFAGSGALGIESLSRGARHVDFVELDSASITAISQALETLGSDPDSYVTHCVAAEQFIEHAIDHGKSYDIIFLDPPFRQGWWEKIFSQLPKIIKTHGLVYLEMEKKASVPELPEKWSVFREKTAGQVRYYLLTTDSK